MRDIIHFSARDVTTRSNHKLIVAAAKANAGLWLMFKEREMEMRAQRAALTKSARPELALVQSELKASFSELAGALVRRIFGNCPPEVIAFFEARRLEAANTEIDSITSGHEHTEAGNPKDG